MLQSDHFIHSPFSFFVIGKEENRSLLLQFILSELFLALKFNRERSFKLIFSSHAFFYPYDWSLKIGCLNKIQEHSILLKKAFDPLFHFLEFFDQSLKTAIERASCDHPEISRELSALFSSLFPFIELCRTNENLLFFLLKHYKDIFDLCTGEKSFFLKLYPEGMHYLQKIVLENYQKREMTSVLSEARSLFEKLNKKHAES